MKTLKQLGNSISQEFRKSKTLTPLENRIVNLHDKLELDNYTLDDIRFMLLQGHGIAFLIPIALKHLEENILLDTKYYEGDLLSALLSINDEYWFANLEFQNQVKMIIKKNKNKLAKNLNKKYEVDLELINKIERFENLQLTK